jgi:arsenate reductase
MPEDSMQKLSIRFLSFERCPGIEPTLARLREAMAAEGVDCPVEMVDVPDESAAKREHFLGSPSIHINGLDIEADRRADPPGFGCRIYPNGKPVPSETLISEALRKALNPKLKVLFLCTGNSCRSQMAESWARALKGDVIEAHSAGIETHGLNPNAVRVMAEAGVDIAGHRSTLVDYVMDVDFDYVVTVCGHAHETCPMFPGTVKVVHVGFDDPPKLAENAASDEEALSHYRRVRDEIKAFVQTLPETLKDERPNDGTA